MPFPAKTSSEAILAAAGKLLAANGAEGLSMRGLAQHLDLAPNALYRYFASRDALLLALSDVAAKALLARLAPATSGLSRKKALRALAVPYLAFAREHPHLYATIVPVEPKAPPAGAFPSHHTLWIFMVDLLQNVVDGDRAPKAALLLWGYLHGMAGLEQAGCLAGLSPDAPLLGFAVLVKGLKRLS